METTPNDIIAVEKLLLPGNGKFSDEAKQIISFWETASIQACPGAGKTTILLAKLKLLSDKMPFENGSGICVLSHTNVAVNEIKKRLTNDAEKILSYPNFVGTVQSFVDTFLAFPYLRNNNIIPHIIDDYSYASIFIKFSNSKYNIKGLINNTLKSIPNLTKEQFVTSLYLDGNGYLWSNLIKTRCLANSTKESTKEYKEIINNIKSKGFVRYSDLYEYSQIAFQEIGIKLQKTLTLRFKYLFIDEYQDCSKEQKALLDNIFNTNNIVIQRIGDKDQAIYNNSDFSIDNEEYNIIGNNLPLTTSNRYGDEIAQILTLLHSDNSSIITTIGQRNIQPVLFVYNNGNEKNVISHFVTELSINNLKRDGTFKAIGMYKNVSGRRLGSYWLNFNPCINTNKKSWNYYVTHISHAIADGKMYHVQTIIIELLTHFQQIKNNTNISKHQILNILKDKYWEYYSDKIISLCKTKDCSFSNISLELKKFINSMYKEKNVVSSLPDFFIDDYENINNNNNNIYTENGYQIEFNTVHGVKGETHDATLYLETEKYKSSDIKRIIPRLESKPINKSLIYEQSRRCVYVGFSRPRYLLCVAINEETFKGHEQAFSSWKIVKI